MVTAVLTRVGRTLEYVLPWWGIL